MTCVEVSHVTKHFGKVCALKDVSFNVKRGEIFGLIGPDGAGKTTLFRILASLLTPEANSENAPVCRVAGYDTVTEAKQVRKVLGYMPGKFSLYQDLSVEENLHFFATLFGTTVQEGYDGIKDIYQQIEPFAKRRAGALSGGMKQKLALSCALIHSPNVLLLDEPTTGVDPVSRKEFWSMIDTLQERGITVIAATPYLDEIRHCHRVAFLSEGSIKGIGTPDEVLERFKDTFTPEPSYSGLMHKVKETEDVIIVEDLVKTFGTFHAVNHISFRVHRGEIFGFLGANGAGKSTAMRILSGLSQPSGGRASVAGFDCATEYEQIKKHIGFMSQKFSLYENLSLLENMHLFGGIYGISSKEIKLRSEEMLQRLGLYELRHSLVASLPLGWKQKLAFSVSIFHHPEVVFLDEPTGGVDPATRQQFWELIYEAAQEGITVFVTTHYMDEATYCDRISIMVDGEIRALGTPQALVEQFQQPDMDHVFTYLARQAKRGDD